MVNFDDKGSRLVDSYWPVCCQDNIQYFVDGRGGQ